MAYLVFCPHRGGLIDSLIDSMEFESFDSFLAYISFYFKVPLDCIRIYCQTSDYRLNYCRHSVCILDKSFYHNYCCIGSIAFSISKQELLARAHAYFRDSEK